MAKLVNFCEKHNIFCKIFFWTLSVISSFFWWHTAYNLCNAIGAIVSGSTNVGILLIKKALPCLISALVISLLSFNMNKLEIFTNSRRRKPKPFDMILKIIRTILMYISYVASLCGFAALCYGTFIMDWRHGGVFFNICLMLLYLSAALLIPFYRFICLHKQKTELVKCNLHLKLPLSLYIFGINLVVLLLFLLSVSINPDAVTLNASGMLPIDHTANFNAVTVVYGLNNLLAPLVATQTLIKKMVK